MNANLKIAVKTFNRIWKEFDKAIQPELDGIFPKGEPQWPGDWVANYADEHYDELLELVAEKFGIKKWMHQSPAQVLQDYVELYKENQDRKRLESTVPWEPWTDEDGTHHHGLVCHEHWDRGFNCQCIPEAEQERIKKALQRGDDPADVIDPGWGPN